MVTIIRLAVVLSTASLFSFVNVLSAEQRPNVVLIMADDLGYHDLGCYGHPKIKTPVLDGLAKDGVRLTSFYSGATVCTPSRMALLTGAYPPRLGWTRGVIGHIMPPKSGMAPAALTMAEIFQSQGYATAITGKWHLGDEPPFRPHRQGFDSAFYINKSNNQTDELWREDTQLEKPFENRLLTEKFATEAVRFIEANSSKPFLLYMPTSAPHFPVQSHPEWKGQSAFGVYGDVVEELDARIGEVVDALKRAEIYENTIIVFLSDNGPEPNEKAQAKPYRGLKWSALEGGTRVPCIFHWSGKIKGGRESDDLVAAIDLLPTLCAACDIDLASMTKASPTIDGVNVWNTIVGRDDRPHARDELLYWHGSKGLHAIRVGDWKLFLRRDDAQLKDTSGSEAALFNLATDPGEAKDVSEEQPEIVRQLQQRAKNRLAEIESNALTLGQE